MLINMTTKFAGMKRDKTVDKLEEQFKLDYTNWQQKPTPKGMSQMLNTVNPIINQGLANYSGGMSGSSTMRGKAKQLTVQAIQNYDPQKGSIKTHLMSHLQRLRRLAAHERQLIRLPERVAISQQELTQTEKDLEDELSRSPTDVEVADRMGMAIKRIAEVRNAARAMPEAMVMQPQEEGLVKEPGVVSLVDDDDEWAKIVYMDLDPINQIILERMRGLNGHKPQSMSQIAKQLKLSVPAVSQRWNKIQQLLSSQADYE
jgi:DNA-directed RNA polymerase specialized sigma subunit